MNKTDIDEQIARLNQQFAEKAKQADQATLKFVTLSCAKVEQTAKQIMRDTEVNPNVSYGPHHHHPSVEGNPPAPDSGTLLQSVTHSVDVSEQGKKVTGYVGSILKNPDYPRYLEFGTSKMQPRPWLIMALMKCQDYISGLKREIFGQ